VTALASSSMADQSGASRAARGFARDRSGATSIEYALLATLIAMSIIGAASLLGGRLGQLFAATAVAF
jgi:pilus assembly protein Flp/PilA